ncbi:MAG: 50S ribosomal protein L4 [Bernardetiaceae bacterium]
MELRVIDIHGNDTGRTVSLSDKVFGREPSDHTLYQAIRLYNANQRQGTHKSKERGEIKGSTKKLRRQKGAGAARVGNIKSPIFRGGGRIFGPRPRNYGFKLNKKMRQVARYSALSYKMRAEAITVVEDFQFEAPRTKAYLELLHNLNLSEQKTLLVTSQSNPVVHLSARNLPKAKVVFADVLNVYDILNADTLILCEGAVEKLNA